MMFQKVLFALGALFAGNAFAQSSFSVYFNGESSTTNCHVDGVSNAQLSTTGSGNLVATAATPLAFSSACGISGSAQQLTFGPAQDLLPATQALAAGSNVVGNFSVRPANAASCTVTFATTGGSGVATGPTSGYVCGPSGSQSCSPSAPIAFSAKFTNTATSTSTYSAQVSCAAASGASPATLLSQQVTVTQSAAGALSNAAITGPTSAMVNAAVNFSGSVTNPNSDPVTWSWNFGDGSAAATGQAVSHTYTTTTGSPFTVTLTVTDTATNQVLTATSQVTVSAASSCASIASSTTGITSFTRLTGTRTVYFFGSGAGTGNQSIDVTSYTSFWGAAFPGNLKSGYVSVPTNTYMSQQFTVPVGFNASLPASSYERYSVGTSSNDTTISMSISTKCGDFSNPATYPTTSSVLPKCWINKALPGGFIQWSNTTSGCNLTDGQTYYLNFINADVSNVTPTGGTAASTTTYPASTSYCTSNSCRMSLLNTGTW